MVIEVQNVKHFTVASQIYCKMQFGEIKHILLVPNVIQRLVLFSVLYISHNATNTFYGVRTTRTWMKCIESLAKSVAHSKAN